MDRSFTSGQGGSQWNGNSSSGPATQTIDGQPLQPTHWWNYP